MPIVSTDCPKCGAPLNVDTGARFIRCAHCQAQLEIQDSGDKLLRESVTAMQDTAAATQRMATETAAASERQVAMIRLNHVQSELKALDGSAKVKEAKGLKGEEHRLLEAVGHTVEPVRLKLRNRNRSVLFMLAVVTLWLVFGAIAGIEVHPLPIIVTALLAGVLSLRQTLV